MSDNERALGFVRAAIQSLAAIEDHADPVATLDIVEAEQALRRAARTLRHVIAKEKLEAAL